MDNPLASSKILTRMGEKQKKKSFLLMRKNPRKSSFFESKWIVEDDGNH